MDHPPYINQIGVISWVDHPPYINHSTSFKVIQNRAKSSGLVRTLPKSSGLVRTRPDSSRIVRNLLESLKLHNFNYTTHIDQLYLNDHISFVSKTTGILEYSGKITRIKYNPDIIHIFYKNHTVKLNPHKYYLFIKQKYTKQNKRDFMKALLNSLN